MSLIIVAICALESGCRYDPTIWRAEVRSPDGLWVAIASTLQTGGFGTAAIMTGVYLKRTNGSQPPVLVLSFWCNGPAARAYVLDNTANGGGTIHLTMLWTSPSQLDVTYDGNASLEFQVVKYAGIEITVQNVKGVTTKAPQ